MKNFARYFHFSCRIISKLFQQILMVILRYCRYANVPILASMSALTLFRKFNLCYSLISSIFNGNSPSLISIRHADYYINYK